MRFRSKAQFDNQDCYFMDFIHLFPNQFKWQSKLPPHSLTLAGEGVEAVRPIRDKIRSKIEALIAEIDAKY